MKECVGRNDVEEDCVNTDRNIATQDCGKDGRGRRMRRLPYCLIAGRHTPRRQIISGLHVYHIYLLQG